MAKDGQIEIDASSSVSFSANSGRLPRACERCWKRKQRCDKTAPECLKCTNSQAICRPRIVVVDVESVDTGAGDPSKSVTHVAGYVAALKRKNEDLRLELQQKRTRLDGPAIDDITSRSVTSPTAPPTSTHSPRSLNHGSNGLREDSDAEDGSVHAAMGEIGYLSLSAMAEPRDTSSSHDQPLSLQKILRAAANLCGSEPHAGKIKSLVTSRSERSSMLTKVTTLCKEEIRQYVQCFLDEVQTRTPAFPEDHVLLLCEALFSPGDDTHLIGSSTALSVLLAYNIIAIGVLHSPDSLTLRPLASRLHHITLKHIPATMENENVLAAFQFMLLLIIYSIHSDSGGSAWHFIGTMMRRLIAVGFHRQQQYRQDADHRELDARRWSFWSCYILDRQVSTVLDRPYAIQDVDITLQDPFFNSSQLSHVSHHLLAHARIMSTIRQHRGKDPLFNWYNFNDWQAKSLILRGSPERPNTRFRSLQQLACRGYNHIVDVRWLEGPMIHGIDGSNLQRVVRDYLRDFVRCVHDKFEEEHAVLSFLDAYDIFNACIVYMLLSADSPNLASDLSEFTSSCSTILTILCQTFKSLGVLRKYIWCLHSAILARPIVQGQYVVTTIQIPAIPDMIQHPPTVIPYRIGQLVRRKLSSENVDNRRVRG